MILFQNNKIKKNKKYWLMVSEPWDYTHPKYGENRILGTVIDVSEEKVIFKSDDKIEIKDIKGDIFICLDRHEGKKVNEIGSPLCVGLLNINYNKNHAVEVKYVIIGNLKRYK